MDQAEMATLKRKQATLAANGQADEAAEVAEELSKAREATAKNIRKRAADAETAKEAAVSDDAVVEKTTTRHR